MEYAVNLREVIYALSEALDFVGIDDISHGKRVAYMAAEVGKQMNFSQEDLDFLIYAGMLHDCGVSSTSVHSHLVGELDWDNSEEHSIRGEELLNSTSFYKKYATLVRYHHTHWDKLPHILSDKEKLFINIIYFVDRIDALRAQTLGNSENSIDDITKTLMKYKNTLFAPVLIDHFSILSKKEIFWYYLENEALEEYLMEWVHKGTSITLSYENVKEICLMFATVVDTKSEFTWEHSLGVSKLSCFLCECYSLSSDIRELIEISSLLHDLGKLRVDDDILNKPGKLDKKERTIMDKHSFDSSLILNKIQGFEKISRLASMHHEKLDGQGYPSKLTANNIPFEARIITVSKIFQDLFQKKPPKKKKKRPYKKGMDKESAYLILKDMAKDGKIDIGIVQTLHVNLDEAYKYATVKKECSN